MTTRSLSLRREALAELTTGELADVAAGDRYFTGMNTCEIAVCVTRRSLDPRYCHSLDLTC